MDLFETAFWLNDSHNWGAKAFVLYLSFILFTYFTLKPTSSPARVFVRPFFALFMVTFLFGMCEEVADPFPVSGNTIVVFATLGFFSVLWCMGRLWSWHKLRAKARRLRLPGELSDPLRMSRPFADVLIIIALIRLLAAFSVGEALIIIPRVISTFLCAVLWFSLPFQAVNAVYLRRNRHDQENFVIRKFIRKSLPADFRLSGIREPARRVWLVTRAGLIIWMLLRYTFTRYLDLEAWNDWPARLWQSLGNVRAVFIDVADISPAVQWEMELTLRCSGLGRIFYIGSEVKDADGWRREIIDRLGLEEQDRTGIHVGVWDRACNVPVAGFEEALRVFIKELPASAPGLRWEVHGNLNIASPSPQQSADAVLKDGFELAQIVLGVAIVRLLVLGFYVLLYTLGD